MESIQTAEEVNFEQLQLMICDLQINTDGLDIEREEVDQMPTSSESIHSASEVEEVVTIEERKRDRSWKDEWKDHPLIKLLNNEEYCCGCSPKRIRISSGSRGNIDRHLGVCPMNLAGPKIHEFFTPKIDQKKLFELLLSAIISTGIPFSIVKNKEFQDLVCFGRPVSLPSPQTVSRGITIRANAMKQRLLDNIKSASRVHLAADCWTDIQTRGYIAVTAHYFDASGRLRSPLLALRHLTEAHTAALLCSSMKEIVEEYLGPNFRQIAASIVTDGGKNIVAAVRELALPGRPCLQHRLQKVLRRAIGQLPDVSTVFASCNYFSRLSKMSIIFQRGVGKIATACPTRYAFLLFTSAISSFLFSY
ncbi:MAG: hypothetical protein K2Q09_06485 [Phycisphaerales bacterium]|nr:hypothetical protein [Phycisphaerales bacterium]